MKKLCGVYIHTNNAPRLAAFYEKVLQEVPLVEGSHYGFSSQLAVYDPGDVRVADDKNISLMYFVDDVQVEYQRLRMKYQASSSLLRPNAALGVHFPFGF